MIYRFDPARDPNEDLVNAILAACRHRKNILLDVGGNWCHWCHRLEGFITNHFELERLRSAAYITVKVHVEEEGIGPEFLEYLPAVTGVPHFFVFNRGGELLHSQPTVDLEEGESYNYLSLATFLKQWTDPALPPLAHSRARQWEQYLAMLLDAYMGAGFLSTA